MKNPFSKQNVKAFLALAFALGTIGLAAVSVVRQDGDVPASLAALVGMTGVIVNSYFQIDEGAK